MKETKFKKLFAAALSVAIGFVTCLGLYSTEVKAFDGTYSVGSLTEFANAITDINSKTSGEYAIELTNDFSVENHSYSLGSGVETTLLGNGHTISNIGTISVTNGKLNIGSSNDTGITLSGINNNDEAGLIYVYTENAEVDMYDNAIIKDSQGNNYYGGGVTVNKGIFHMYGGTIQNCGIYGGSNCFGGGVGVINGGQFIMEDGATIKDCYVKGTYGTNWAVPNCAGGAIFLSNKASFIMNGGTIENCYATNFTTSCKCASGGAIAAPTSYYAYQTNGMGAFDSAIIINGGTIQNCHADSNGGAIFAGGYYVQSAAIGAIENAIQNPNPYGITINNATFTGNTAGSMGGAMLFSIIKPGITINKTTISNNEATYGGGIAINSLGYAQTNLNVSNSNIIENGAGQGGGLYIYNNTSGVVDITTSNVCNNTVADDGEGSDVYFKNTKNGETTLKLPNAATMTEVYKGLPSDITNNAIDGWYEDYNIAGNDDYQRFYTQSADKRTLENTYANMTIGNGEYIALVAAANASYVEVSFDAMGIGIAPTTQKIKQNEVASEPIEAEWQNGYIATATNGKNYVFGGWYVDDTFTTTYDFTSPVANDITLYAKWTYTDYIPAINVNKTYLIKDGYTGAGTQLDTTNKIKEDVTFTIVPYASFNREAGKTDIPEFAPSYTISIGNGNDFTSINMPSFASAGIGEYWYEVQEQVGNSTGVKYDTNKYYMHIVVTSENDNNANDIGVSQVTLHKTAPNADGSYENATNDKVSGFTNEFAVGSLDITKELTGNMINESEYFEVTITFTAPENTVVNTGIVYNGGFKSDKTAIVNETIASGWSNTTSITLLLTKDSKVTFTNIPDGVKYTIVEKDYTADGYENPTFTVSNNESDDIAANGQTWSDNSASGSISNDEDSVVIANVKNAVIDIGVVTDNAPFIILLVSAALCGVVLVMTNRRKLYN